MRSQWVFEVSRAAELVRLGPAPRAADLPAGKYHGTNFCKSGRARARQSQADFGTRANGDPVPDRVRRGPQRPARSLLESTRRKPAAARIGERVADSAE